MAEQKKLDYLKIGSSHRSPDSLLCSLQLFENVRTGLKIYLNNSLTCIKLLGAQNVVQLLLRRNDSPEI